MEILVRDGDIVEDGVIFYVVKCKWNYKKRRKNNKYREIKRKCVRERKRGQRSREIERVLYISKYVLE